MPRTAPTISDPNRMLSAGTIFSRSSIPARWYTQVSKKTLLRISSASGGRFMSWAMPR